MLDAIGQTVAAVTTIEAHRYVVVVHTDGMENASHEWTKEKVKHLIASREHAGNWTFTFFGCDIDAWGEAGAMGFARGNSKSYAAENTAEMYRTSSRVANVMRERKIRSTQRYADATDEEIERVLRAPASKGTIEDTTADDNCPNVANADQLNSDSPRFAPAPQPVNNDSSDPDQDLQGDVCDTDDDNDAMSDVVEAALYLQTTGAGAVNGTDPDDPNHCGDINKTSAGDGSDLTPADDFALAPTLPDDSDTDNDGALDGRECQLNFGPRYSGTPRPAGPALTAVEEVEYRTIAVNHRTIAANGAVETDCDDMLDDDGDLVADDGCTDSGNLLESADFDGDNIIGTSDVDSDGDGALDGNEVKFYGSLPSSDDSDGDGCRDGVEIADVASYTIPNTAPADRKVNVIDLQQIYRAGGPPVVSGNIRIVAGPYGTEVDQTRINFDIDRNGTIGIIDLAAAAARSGNCGGGGGTALHQGGLTITLDIDGNLP